MRSVRRGLVATALAFPLALGFAGVAGASEKGEVDYAAYEASFAAASPEGAAAGEVSSEALHAEFEKHGKKHHGKKDGDARHGKHGKGEKEIDYAAWEFSGAAASPHGAIAWDIDSEALHAEKG
ncbi:hypothetical protein SAXI111661_01345 [Saccharomonospora xinjiangensis]|uniref:hypothetical protein n=1 Tax=Saccharomonospora xinjiangensis TaxID=75294 RepID=UPI001070475E|nr:hypothetical protein [Saccharomonospora xinjiangensis]QBQ62215.1 hypothetical protein EYD13_19380 [Saccharomonospora xinjiangensis]